MEEVNNNSQKDLSALIRPLGDILAKTLSQTQHIDAQINILIGINSAIFIYSTSKLDTNSAAIFSVLGIASVMSLIVGLLAVHPPGFLRSRSKQNIDQAENLFKHSTIFGFSTPSQYGEALTKTFQDPEKIIQAYAGQIYSISKYYYRPKREMFKLSRNIMLWGMIISAILFLYVRII